MSRPQFTNQSPQQLQVAGGRVVNDGLIDFQDNMQRGVSEYVTPQHFMASGYGGGFPSGVSPPVPQQQPYVAQAPYAVYPGYPAPPQLSSGIAPGGQGGGCISGPPAFLQVGGLVYKPVDSDAPVGPPTQSAPPAAPAKPSVSKQASTAKMLTEDDLHRAIDSRVQSKVESYLSSQRKSHHSAPRAVEEPSTTVRSRDTRSSSSHRPYTSSARPAEGPVTRSARRISSDEELAIQRVQEANATMRAPPSSSRGAQSREERGLKW